MAASAYDDVDAYGKLLEGLHITGYTFERACENLRFLLQEDRWKLGGRFHDPNQFLDSIRLDKFRTVAEQRKEISRLIKELTNGAASNRQIARTLGVSYQTVNNDVDKKLSPTPGNINDLTLQSDKNLARPLSGEQAARLVKRRERRAREPLASSPNAETGIIADLHHAIAQGRRWATIYADPPWLYDNQGTRAATQNHYPGLTIDELCELPVAELAADNAHLHLWVTNAFLFEAPTLFDAWGFEFKSSFVWVKSEIGIGNYWRNAHEFLLTAVRGNARRFNDANLPSWIECNRGRHSSKPEQVRAMLERASPGPYLELFAREKAERWDAWGNAIAPTLFTSR
jgi:N6-adenosine-specific RNA methylase IME4